MSSSMCLGYPRAKHLTGVWYALGVGQGDCSKKGNQGGTVSITRKQVRSDFVYARHLMRLADCAMRDGVEDLTESGDAYQIALELQASAGAFTRYLDDLRKQQEEVAV